jgi:hypothetical protein
VTPIPFIGPEYQSRSENYSSQRCLNWYLEPGKGKAPALLIGCPGLTAPRITLAGSGGIRGMFKIDDETSIMVRGATVYKVTNAYVSTSLGTVSNDARPVQIAWNGANIVITSDEIMYSLTLAGSSSTVIQTGVEMVDTLGDFFVAALEGSNSYTWSDAISAVFPGNEQATNSVSDQLVGVKVARRAAYFFGTKSIEPWYESGGVDVPFSRIDGGVFEVGCIAKDSIAEMDALFWLGGDEKGTGQVWTISGGAPKRISTPAIEFALAQWPDMEDAEAFCYSQEGHSFYVLSSQSGNQTFAYDITTEEWHERAWLHTSGDFQRIRPRCAMHFAGEMLVGDWETGNVYAYDLNTYSDNGNPLITLRSCSTLESGMEEQGTVSFLLDMDTGVGLTTGQGSDPQAMLRYSKDGGKTWSSSLWRSFGQIGEYWRRAIWNRVGGGRRLVFEVRISDPVKRNVTGAYIS